MMVKIGLSVVYQEIFSCGRAVYDCKKVDPFSYLFRLRPLLERSKVHDLLP